MTKKKEPAASEGRIVVFDILSDDLFREKTGWSFFHLYPCDYNQEIETEAYIDIENE